MMNDTHRKIARAAQRHGWLLTYRSSDRWEYAKEAVRVRVEWSASGSVARAQRWTVTRAGDKHFRRVHPGDIGKSDKVVALLARATTTPGTTVASTKP